MASPTSGPATTAAAVAAALVGQDAAGRSSSSSNRGLLVTFGLATAALTLTAGGIAWVRNNNKCQSKTSAAENESQQPEVSAALTKEEKQEEVQSRPQSWSDLVDEEEALEMQSTSSKMSHPGTLDDVRLSSKLEELSLEKQQDVNRKSRSSSDKTAKPTLPLLEKCTSGDGVVNSDSGVVSPTAPPPITQEKIRRESQCSDEAGDSNFDSSSSVSSVNPVASSVGGANGGAETVLSDSGQGSEADETAVMVYNFYIPTYLCGKLIGVQGQNVKYLKAETRCNINLRLPGKGRKDRRSSKQEYNPNELQVCVLEGTRAGIDKCLDLIRERFPIDQFPDLSLEQTNPPEEGSYHGEAAFSPQFGLAQGVSHEVVVSAIVSGGQVFIQQPSHPTYHLLERLNDCMQHVYAELVTPEVVRPIQVGLVCVALTQGRWYRVQVMTYDSLSDSCDVKFLDEGGYETLLATDLRQIRSDFLALPFQAIECYLSNIIPSDGVQWSLESGLLLGELVANKVCAGQMIGYSADGLPMIQLYLPMAIEDNQQQSLEPVLVNRELVERGVASWLEAVPAVVELEQQ